MASQRRRLHPALGAAALPGAALGLMIALPPTPVQAQTAGADLKVVSPQPGAALGASAFSLDVSFHSRTSAPITSAELWVDGVRWVHRDLQTPQVKNVLSFAIDSSSLGEGTHTFLVRVLTANGGIGETTLTAITGSEGSAVASAAQVPAMKFSSPSNGRRVMGQVELSLDAPAVNGVNPYVTIYVDKQFKTLKNFPPYNYTWDTTNVPNGLHTIEATSYLESSQLSTSRAIKVIVDNAGGNTALKSEIPDLSAPAASTNTLNTARTVSIAPSSAPVHTILAPVGAPILSEVTHTAKPVEASSAGLVSSLPTAVPTVHDLLTLQAPVLIKPVASHIHHVTVAAPAVSLHPRAEARTISAATVSLPTMVVPVSTASAALEVASAPQMTAIAPSAAIRPIVSEGIPALTAPQFVHHTAHVAHPTVAHVAHPTAPHLAVLAGPATVVHAGNVVSTPTVSPATPLLPAPMIAAHAVLGVPHRYVAHRTASHGGMRANLRPNHNGILQSADYRPIEVAFNGQQIAFDVQPRVEAGLPIAPFRQIFEHTGGQVDWVEKTQVVHAVNAEKEIVIKVGAANATVNGKNVTMARPAFTERGRTIVPLSFVGDALDVNVNYDPATGKLQITSK